MLTLFFLHVIITIVCTISGFLFYTVVARPSRNTTYKPVVVYIITGLITISFLSQLLVLFFPINLYVKSILIIMLAAGVFVARKKCNQYFAYLIQLFKSFPLPLILLITAAWFMIALISAGPTIMDDTESYHIQSIKWIQEFGTVPGLVNLHERFGFNASWFTLISVFIPSKSSYNYFSLLNGLLSVWLSAYLFTTLWKHFTPIDNEKRHLHPGGLIIMLLFAIVCWPLLRGNAANANYDFVTTFIIIVLFLDFRHNNATTNIDTIELFLWPVFLFTVRITNVPFLLVSFFAFIYLIRRKNTRLLLTLSVISLSILTAFIARNIILSGYLFYPFYQIDFFHFDWKGDYEATRKISTFIKYFNRVNDGFIPISETQKLSGISWIPVWFRYLVYYDKFICIAATAGALVTFIFYKKLQPLSGPVKIILAACALQLIVWFFVAPDPRFAYGPLLTGCYLLADAMSFSIYRVVTIRFRTYLFVPLSVIIVSYSALKIIVDKNYRNPFVPVLVPVPPVKTTHLNSIELRIPEKILDNWNARCYGTALPCLYEIKPGLKARTNQLKDGFKIEKQ